MGNTITSMQENKENTATIEEGRVENLPESLRIHLLSFLNTKEAVQISMLSKQCLSLWTSNPILRLNSFDFRCVFDFDKFVNHVLRYRDHSVELNTLTFTCCCVSPYDEILNKVLGYAFSHGLNHLELQIEPSKDTYWDVWHQCSYGSLKTLKLKTQGYVPCGVLSRSFKNLTVLYLIGANIRNIREPFLGFPMLEILVLEDCYLGNILRVHGLKLSYLTISSCRGRFDHCKLTTPNLRFFNYRGSEFPRLETHDGLPVLDTVVLRSSNFFRKKRMNGLISLFSGLGNAKSVTLSWSVVWFLCLFRGNLKELDSPFCNLKCLNIDVRHVHHWQSMKMHADVKAYLFKGSPQAKFNIIRSSD